MIQGNTPRVASINGKVSSATAAAGSISSPYEPACVGESSVTPILLLLITDIMLLYKALS